MFKFAFEPVIIFPVVSVLKEDDVELILATPVNDEAPTGVAGSKEPIVPGVPVVTLIDQDLLGQEVDAVVVGPELIGTVNSVIAFWKQLVHFLS